MATATQTPADLLSYQRELVRTGNYIALGRMLKISIGPSADYAPPDDPIIRRWGRMIDFRNYSLPIAQSVDRSIVLVTAPLAGPGGAVHLPDLPDPDWKRPELTREEIEGREVKQVVDGREYTTRQPVAPDPAKHSPPMLVQKLTDRCEQMDGRPGVMAGTDFLMFQPVLRVVFQPEIEKRLTSTAWILNFCGPDGSLLLDMERRCCSLLVDHKTGECHFFGGRYDIFSGLGDQ